MFLKRTYSLLEAKVSENVCENNWSTWKVAYRNENFAPIVKVNVLLLVERQQTTTRLAFRPFCGRAQAAMATARAVFLSMTVASTWKVRKQANRRIRKKHSEWFSLTSTSVQHLSSSPIRNLNPVEDQGCTSEDASLHGYSFWKWSGDMYPADGFDSCLRGD